MKKLSKKKYEEAVLRTKLEMETFLNSIGLVRDVLSNHGYVVSLNTTDWSIPHFVVIYNDIFVRVFYSAPEWHVDMAYYKNENSIMIDLDSWERAVDLVKEELSAILDTIVLPADRIEREVTKMAYTIKLITPIIEKNWELYK